MHYYSPSVGMGMRSSSGLSDPWPLLCVAQLNSSQNSTLCSHFGQCQCREVMKEILEGLVEYSSSNFCDLRQITYFMPQFSHLWIDEVILLFFMILFWFRPISIKNAIYPGQVRFSRVRWDVEVQRHKVTLKKIYRWTWPIIWVHVSYIMSSKQKFHKEKAYEATVRSATHSPLL